MASLEDYDFIEISSPDQQFEELRSAVPEFDWDRWVVRDPETKGQKIKRNVSRAGARLLEGAVGGLGDVQELASQGAGWAAEKLTGRPQEGVRQFVRGEHPIQQKPGIQQFVLGGRAPSSAELRENITEPILGEKDKPYTPIEEFIDEVSGDIGSLFSLGGKGLKQFTNAVGTAVGSNIVKEGVKGAGIGEKGQEAAKLGTMFLSGLVKPGRLNEAKRRLYSEANNLLPEGAVVSSVPLRKNISTLSKELEKGGGSQLASKKELSGWVKQLESRMQGDMIPVEELTEFKHNLNEWLGNKSNFKGAENLAFRLSKDVDNAIEMYGQQSNKKFLKKYREANLLHAGLNQKNAVADFLSKPFRLKGMSPSSMALLSYVLHQDPKVAAAIVGAGVTAETLRTAQRYLTNPAVRKQYTQVMLDAAAQDSAALNKSLKKFDDAVRQEEKKRKRQDEASARFGRGRKVTQ